MTEGSFTVTFENPYWVGVFERFDERGYSAAKIIFGAEPNAEIIHMTILYEYRRLVFSSPTLERLPQTQHVNYKRRQRELSRLLEQKDGITQDASDALNVERKRAAMERKQQAKAAQAVDQAHKFQMQQDRKKEKKKGH